MSAPKLPIGVIRALGVVLTATYAAGAYGCVRLAAASDGPLGVTMGTLFAAVNLYYGARLARLTAQAFRAPEPTP